MPVLAAEKIEPFASSRELFSAIESYLISKDARNLTHSELERELEKRCQELMRSLLQAHMDVRGPGEAVGPVAGSDGVAREQERLHERGLETIFGEVQVRRLGYRAEGGDSLHPLDADLNLPSELYSHEVRGRVAEEVAQGSFAATVKHLHGHTGTHVGRRQVEELTARVAQDFDHFYEEREGDASRDGSHRLKCVEVPSFTNSAPKLAKRSTAAPSAVCAETGGNGTVRGATDAHMGSPYPAMVAEAGNGTHGFDASIVRRESLSIVESRFRDLTSANPNPEQAVSDRNLGSYSVTKPLFQKSRTQIFLCVKEPEFTAGETYFPHDSRKCKTLGVSPAKTGVYLRAIRTAMICPAYGSECKIPVKAEIGKSVLMPHWVAV
jgi:hypothetical protein